MSKKRSPTWEYFTLSETEGKKKATCKLCKVSLVYLGGTTSMRNHLESKHPGSLDSKPQAQTSGIRMAGCMAPDIRNFVSTSPKMTNQRYSVINKKLAEMCAMDYRPISIVNGQGFKHFVQALDPNYTVPSHTTIRNYVHRSYVDARDKIKSIISKSSSVSLTADLWTCHATQSYITVTCHFLLDDWTLSSQVLATKHVTERHTGANIAEEIKSIIDDYALQDVACIIHDNAANMEVAMQKLGIPHLGCAGHTLQLSVNDGLKLPELSKTLARCRNLVSYFHRSFLANDALQKRQKQESRSGREGGS